MKVVTSGSKYLDIDAYAGCIAYAELLNVLGDNAVAASTAPLNESVTAAIRDWNVPLVRDYQPGPEDVFITVDISEPEIFDSFVVLDRVVEVIDHHLEFIDYWQKRPAVKSEITFIGAACTLIYERWYEAGKIDKISQTSARLLIAGIVDNTLNFEASFTTDRDKVAYKELMKWADLPNDWAAQYFADCEQGILSDIGNAIIHDSKLITFPSLQRKIATGQLVLWNATPIIEQHFDGIAKHMQTISSEWFMNIVSIEEGRNYLLASDTAIQQFLETLMNVKFVHGIATTDKLWLRKEIMKKDLEANS